jgi:hypothetical protein
VRGCNLLIPHAFFYAVRWPRNEECPPQLGPHSPWWDEPRLRSFHDYAARLCWLNTDSRHVCEVAILAQSDAMPWQAAKVLQQHQIDFNYIESRHLWEDATVDAAGIHLADMTYRALIVDGIEPLPAAGDALATLTAAGRTIAFGPASPAADPDRQTPASADDDLLAALDRLVPRDCICEPGCEPLRVRHVVKGNTHWYLLHNEGAEPIDTSVTLAAAGRQRLIDPMTCEVSRVGDGLRLAIPGYAMAVVQCTPWPTN